MTPWHDLLRQLQFAGMDDGTTLVVHPGGSFVLHADFDRMTLVLDSVRAGTEALDEELGEFADALHEALTQSVPPLRERVPRGSVVVLGHSRGATDIYEHIRGLGDSRLKLLERKSTKTRTSWPERGKGALDFDEQEVEQLLDSHDVVIIVAEELCWGALERLNQLAIGARRASVLVVTLDPDAVIVGPAIRGGAPCWYCARFRRIGASASIDPDVVRAIGGLGMGAWSDLPEQTRTVALSTIVRQVAGLLGLAEPSTPCLSHEVDHDGVVHTRSRPPVRGCPECAKAKPPDRETAGFAWSEYGDQLEEPRQHQYRLRRVCSELERRGVSGLPHAISTFGAHLLDTWRILSRWGLDEATCLAGLMHSVYGSSAFDQPVFSWDERDRVRQLIGTKAERLVHLFCTTNRTRLHAELERNEPNFDRFVPVHNWRTGESMSLSSSDVAALLVIDAANVAQQQHAGDRSPGIWVSRCSRRLALARLLGTSFGGPIAEVTAEKEERSRASYLNALASFDDGPPPAAFEAVGRENPLIGEPLILAGLAALSQGAREQARLLTEEGRHRMRAWATAWDKRLSLEEWEALADRVQSSELVELPQGLRPTVSQLHENL